MDKILIVDDEPDIIESLSVMLSSKGYDVISAENGRDAVARAQADHPDVILLDITMPEMNGIEACRRLKQSDGTKHIPVLMLTALNSLEDRVRGLDAGADDFVGKPFNDVELRARIAAFLRTKRLHDDLESNFLKLKELEELRDSLVHMMVHDLKAPLTAVQGGIAIVQERVASGGALDEAHRKLLANAHDATKRLVNLIQDMLDVNRLEENRLPLKRRKIDVGALAAVCAEMLRPAAERNGISIAVRTREALPFVDADDDLLQRVIVNILSNSLKFTPAGGQVSLEVSRDGGAVVCAISDTGAGIPKEYLEKIFDKFFQISDHSSSRKGQGLGLAFCRMAVESHGGTIRAESEAGQGSRFIIRLPVE